MPDVMSIAAVNFPASWCTYTRSCLLSLSKRICILRATCNAHDKSSIRKYFNYPPVNEEVTYNLKHAVP